MGAHQRFAPWPTTCHLPPARITPAVKSGMLCARGRRLLMMDADGATRVSDLERLEARLEQISSELIPSCQRGWSRL